MVSAQPAWPDAVQRRSARRRGASAAKERRVATNGTMVEGGETA
jgi:hypothetical protein